MFKTFAWYQADAQAKVNVTTAKGNLTTTASSISAGTYTIGFTVAAVDAELQLSHVVSAADVTAGLNGIADPAAGDLIFGVISNGSATMRKCASISDFGTTFTITPSWTSAPTDPAEKASVAGKKFTINLSVTGNAHFLGAGSAVVGQSNADTATAVVHIANDASLTLSVDTISLTHVHVEPTSISASETGTVGAVQVDAADNVTLVNDN